MSRMRVATKMMGNLKVEGVPLLVVIPVQEPTVLLSLMLHFPTPNLQVISCLCCDVTDANVIVTVDLNIIILGTSLMAACH